MDSNIARSITELIAFSCRLTRSEAMVTVSIVTDDFEANWFHCLLASPGSPWLA